VGEMAQGLGRDTLIKEVNDKQVSEAVHHYNR
jgi:hypothetical protein